MPVGYGLVPFLALGGILTIFQIVECLFIGGYKTSSCAHLYGEVAEGQPSLHRHVAYHLSGILHEVARGSAGGELCYEVEGHVLGCDTLGKLSVDGDAHGLGLLLEDALRGQHHLHLGGTYAEGYCSHSPVGRGMAVSADDGHAGQ